MLSPSRSRTIAAGMLAVCCAAAPLTPASALPGPRLPAGRVEPPARTCDGLLLAMRTHGTSAGPGLWRLGPDGSLRLLAELGRRIRPVGGTVAPDGRTVALEVDARQRPRDPGMSAFSRSRVAPASSSSILVLTLRAGGRAAVAGRLAGSSPSWSPDGRRLAFERGGVIVVTRRGFRGAAAVVWGRDPAWSPRRNVLAFARPKDRWGSSIRLLTPSGIRAVTWPSRIDVAPVWSPDGRLILFGRRKRPGGWSDLWVVRPDGGGERRLTHFNHYNGAVSPVWSPDGRRVAFTMANSEGWAFFLSHVATGAITVPDHPVDLGLGPETSAGEWSSHHTVVYEAGVDRRSLWEHSVRDGASRRILPRMRYVSVLARGVCRPRAA